MGIKLTASQHHDIIQTLYHMTTEERKIYQIALLITTPFLIDHSFLMTCVLTVLRFHA